MKGKSLDDLPHAGRFTVAHGSHGGARRKNSGTRRLPGSLSLAQPASIAALPPLVDSRQQHELLGRRTSTIEAFAST